MKTITFQNDKIEYSIDILKDLLGKAPDQNGLTIEQVRTSIKVLDVIDASIDGVIRLEDAEYNFVKHRISVTKWIVATKDLVEFIDAVMNAE